MRRSFLSICLLTAFSFVSFDPAAAMSFRTARLGDTAVIAATGQITEGTASEFLSYLQGAYGGSSVHAVVLLNSPGGRVMASMEFGQVLRRIGATAIVAGIATDGEGNGAITNAQCMSACVYTLMGGRRRVIPSSSQVGIHRMFLLEEDVDRNGEAYLHRRYDDGTLGSILKRYTASMGVSPSLITAAEHIPSANLKILSRGEIRRYNLGSGKF